MTQGVNVPAVYVAVEIEAPLEAVWDRTQQPDPHTRWDLRFSRIEYLPRSNEDEPQRFLYETRIGFGLKIRGEGAFVGTKQGIDLDRLFWGRSLWSGLCRANHSCPGKRQQSGERSEKNAQDDTPGCRSAIASCFQNSAQPGLYARRVGHRCGHP